jgi:flagellar biosynthesis protein FlhA
VPQQGIYRTWNFFRQQADILVALVFILVIVLIILPVPPVVLDILLVLNIAFSLIILLTTLFLKVIMQLSSFPSLLLMTTLVRLALNISSTRLILSEARAGEVIDAFGRFVVGGDFIVGLVIFIIITVIQFVVITNGSGRIAEVAARFTLDALPGKQMSIDADFNAGLIDEATARQRRQKLQQEADFYGAMDGASKFVRGDAVAGIVIVLINIFGGLAIGTLRRGMLLVDALHTYTLLTVGDGLVAQIPALLVSTSAGMLVTRSAAEAGFGQEVTGQLLNFPRAVALTAGILFALGLVPNLPFFPFFVLALVTGGIAYLLTEEQKFEEQKKKRLAQEKAQSSAAKPTEEEDLRSLLQVDPLSIEIGYNLVVLTDTGEGGDLLERITAARRRAISELGMLIQPIRIRDNLQLPANEYLIKIKGNTVARGDLRPGHYLALIPGNDPPEVLGGIPTREPTFNMPALWIPESEVEEAELQGCAVVDASTVLITHLTEVIKTHAHELLGRQEVRRLLDIVKEKQPAVVEELVPDLMSIGEIQKVLQNLLEERIPLTDLVTILETLADYAPITKETDLLTEYVRQALSRTITELYSGGEKINVITLDPRLEETLAGFLQHTSQGTYLAVEPQKGQRIVEGLNKILEGLQEKGIDPLLLTSPRIRLPFRRFITRFLPRLPVVSIQEILPNIEVKAVGVLKDEG